MITFFSEIPSRHMRLLFIIVIYLQLIPMLAQSTIDSERISAYVEEIKESHNLPGVTVSITDKNSTLYLEHFGKITADEQLLIGSTSKSFTALLTLKLEQKELLNLNDPVVKYLSWFQYEDKSRSDKILIRDLLQQTSGIPSIFGRMTVDEDSTGSTKKSIQKLLSTITLESTEIGYAYSNINYRLLGFIIEEVTGLSFGAALEQNILQPLHLKHTSGFVLSKDSKAFPRSYNYFLYYPILPYTSNYPRDEIPGGYVASNAGDMAIYLREHLKSYVDDSSDLIDKNIAVSLFTPKDLTKSKYGYGWFINNWQNREVFYHTGLAQGFNTCMIVLPTEDKAIFVGINSGVDQAFEIAAGIFHLLIDKEPREFSTLFFYLIRSLPFLAIILITFLIFNVKKWRKKNFRVGLSRKLIPNLLLCLGVIFGSLWVIIFPILYNTTMKVIIDYDPTSGISLIIVACSIILISVINYFNNQSNTSALS